MNVVTDDYAEKHSVHLQQTPDITYAVFKFDTKIVILCQFIRIFEKKYMFFYYISNNFCTSGLSYSVPLEQILKREYFPQSRFSIIHL